MTGLTVAARVAGMSVAIEATTTTATATAVPMIHKFGAGLRAK